MEKTEGIEVVVSLGLGRVVVAAGQETELVQGKWSRQETIQGICPGDLQCRGKREVGLHGSWGK